MDLEPVPFARMGRAVALMAASVVAIAIGSVAYLYPNLYPNLGRTTMQRAAPPAPVAYHLTALDFVSRDVGWVVADLVNGDYALLHTTDGGLTWATQLSAPAGGSQEYVKFFDPLVGVFALMGTRPVLERTADGGRTWTSIPVLGKHTTVLSWSFIDSDHGWMLADPASGSPPRLYSTEDMGWRWHDHGSPVQAPYEAFSVRFSFLTTGWVAGAGLAPDAYRTGDFGETWSRVRLPAPDADRSDGGRFFVDVQQTSGGGLIASIVHFSDYMGRGGSSGRIRQFPPLPVPFYDGSRPNDYVYSTMIDQVIGAPNSAVQAPRAALIRSLDNGASWVAVEPPALSGTLGYASKSMWIWVDAGAWSRSDDGGLTWVRHADSTLVEPLPGSLQFVDRDHAWYAAAGAPSLETTSDGGRRWRLVALPQALT